MDVKLEGTNLVLTNMCYLVKSSYHDVNVVLQGSLGGLSTTDTFRVELQCVGSTGPEHSTRLDVYPNPTSGSFRLEAPGLDKARVEVYNLTGNLVMELPMYHAGEPLDLSGRPSGAYLLRVVSDRHIYSTIIQKQ
jgi:hypothetical protein